MKLVVFEVSVIDGLPYDGIIDGAWGTEEGDWCNQDGCSGTLEFPIPENCTCFISPPCSVCENLRITCSKCKREIE